MNKETELTAFTEDYLRCKSDIEGSFHELSDLFYAMCESLDGEVQQNLLAYWNKTSGDLQHLLDTMSNMAKK